MNNPEMLLFDQPSVSLDAKSVRTVWQIIQILTKEQQSMLLLTTHDMNEIEQHSEKAGILIKGDLVCIDNCFESEYPIKFFSHNRFRLINI